MKIYQILTTLSFGDAVSNDCLAIRKLLIDRGYKTMTFAENIDKRIIENDIKYYNKLPKIKDDDIILYHLSTGTALNRRIKELPGRKFVIYHNITPPDFFVQYSGRLAKLCADGHDETVALKDTFEGGFCDSSFNRDQLISYGFKCPLEVRPILIPFEDYKKEPDQAVIDFMNDGIKNVLFVGRVAPNKCQQDLISMLYAYRKMYKDPIRLILVGSSVGTEKYMARLKCYAEALGLEDVVFTGQIPFSQILAYYRSADAFVCMSEHEGFCVPLTEAMSFDVPILAYDSCAVPETLGGSGAVIGTKDPATVAAYLHEILNNEELRRLMIADQRTRLADFSYDRVAERFMDILTGFIGDRG